MTSRLSPRALKVLGAVLAPLAAAAIIWACTKTLPGARSKAPGTVGEVWAPATAAVRSGYPLALSADRRHLVDATGSPFLIHGEAAWSLVVQLDREQAETYLEDRRRRGFNLLLVNLLEHHFSPHAPANAYGKRPFASDFSTPNAEYFDHVDWVLKRAADKGLAVLLCPAYLGYAGGDEGWYREMVKSGAEKLRGYGRFVGARYKDFPNLLWLEGGDFTPPPEHLALVNAVAEGIKEAGARQLHAVHWSPETSGAEVTVSGWLDLDTTYTYEPVYLKSRRDYERADGRPHFLLESTYEGEHESTPWSLRGQAYGALLSGAVGQIFGNKEIWRFDPGWIDALGGAGSVGMTHVRTLFASFDWTKLRPD
ncbi:MAG TPA: DUF4038 domain-containing protein, partial [Polyangiaceae bacterium]